MKPRVAFDEESQSYTVVCTDCGASSSPKHRAQLALDSALCSEGFADYGRGRTLCPKCRASAIPIEKRVGWLGDLCAKLGLEVPKPPAPEAEVPAPPKRKSRAKK